MWLQWSVLIAALAGAGPSGAGGYVCTATGAADPDHWLVRDRSGGSMGNPAQRSACQLPDAGSGQVVMCCPAGIRGERIVCTDATLGAPSARFVLDPASGRFASARIAAEPAPGRSGQGDTGMCRSPD